MNVKSLKIAQSDNLLYLNLVTNNMKRNQCYMPLEDIRFGSLTIHMATNSIIQCFPLTVSGNGKWT